VLYELEGFSLPEIAEALQVPLGTATSRLRRARGNFEAWVAGRSAEAGDEP
jgi:RNA polymerase sigma-70 factor (ECF subfamily)